jgi:hypothetical protein
MRGQQSSGVDERLRTSNLDELQRASASSASPWSSACLIGDSASDPPGSAQRARGGSGD